MTSKICGAATGIAMALLTAAPVDAQSYTTQRWTSRVLVGRLLTDAGQVRVEGRQPTTEFEIGDGMVALYDLSRDVSGPFAVQVGFGVFSLPARAIVTETGASAALSELIDLERIWTAEYHASIVYRSPGFGIFDAYVGPILAGIARDVAMPKSEGRVAPISISSALGAGIQGGLRIKGCSCEGFALDVNVRRTFLRPVVTGGASAKISPWILSAGVSIRH